MRIERIESSSFPIKSNILFSKGLDNKNNKGGLNTPRQLSNDDNNQTETFYFFSRIWKVIFNSTVTDRTYDKSDSNKKDILKIIFRGTVIREKIKDKKISGEESILAIPE